jgi:hypothetical protein
VCVCLCRPGPVGVGHVDGPGGGGTVDGFGASILLGVAPQYNMATALLTGNPEVDRKLWRSTRLKKPTDWTLEDWRELKAYRKDFDAGLLRSDNQGKHRNLKKTKVPAPTEGDLNQNPYGTPLVQEIQEVAEHIHKSLPTCVVDGDTVTHSGMATILQT